MQQKGGKKRNSYSAKKSEKDDLKMQKRFHNVIMVNSSYGFKSLVTKTKNLLKNRFEFVELHAVDDRSYLTISLVAQTLMKYKYVTLTRLKTMTH